MNARPKAAPESDAVLAQWLARIAAGDPQAVAGLYEASVSRVYGLVLRVVRDPSDAEEVIGDLYLQVWERAADFDPRRGSALAWLRTLAWSRAVDHQRRQRRHAMEVSLHPDDDAPAYASMACEELDPGAAAEAWSSARSVREAFDHLTDIQRRILTLAFQQEMSHRDIALATGLPLGTVKSHARRGLQALRAALGVEGGDDD